MELSAGVFLQAEGISENALSAKLAVEAPGMLAWPDGRSEVWRLQLWRNQAGVPGRPVLVSQWHGGDAKALAAGSGAGKMADVVDLPEKSKLNGLGYGSQSRP